MPNASKLPVEAMSSMSGWSISFNRVERSYGYFSSTLELPSEVDQENIDTNYKKGVLRLVFTKTKETEGKKIEIKTG